MLVFGILLAGSACIRTKGPKYLSQPVWEAGRRSVPAFQRAYESRDSDAKLFDPRFAEAETAADAVGRTNCNCSDQTILKADQIFKNDLRHCVSFLRAYRTAQDQIKAAQTKDELDQAVTAKESATAVLLGCSADLARATSD
jgi:hypothetical protein